jgi:hypothetical protein
LVRVTSLPLVLGTTQEPIAGVVVDVQLGLVDVDVDVDQGVPVGVADAQRLSGDLGDASAGDASLHP